MRSKANFLTSGKSRTGIIGLDAVTRGGLPAGRATLLLGGPGSGKTVLALQTLVNGVRLWNEPGIFVAFEENSRRIIANSAGFGWNLPVLQRGNLFFLDAKQQPDVVLSGSFDLSGLLAGLGAKARKMKAKRIVFDSVDVLLERMQDPMAKLQEVHRLHEWLLEHELTALMTSQVYGDAPGVPDKEGLGFMQFMVDCAIALKHEVVEGVSQRNLRVTKFRGSSFMENEVPFVIDAKGLEVAGSPGVMAAASKVSKERVSTGIERLDTMLDGGYYRGASVLVTGSPGTAKTTLSGSFARAACSRGEQTLFVSFDSRPDEIVRNLDSVNIRLGNYVNRRTLGLFSARTAGSSAEVQFMRIKELAYQCKARNLVIDPISALLKQGNGLTAHNVVERLCDWVKDEGMTMVCTSLLDDSGHDSESTPVQISTIADTWIHLNYLVRAGERNRALTIIKSRGTSHSNQVRELILDRTGVKLEEVYLAGGEVLMGTLRWEREEALRAQEHQKRHELRNAVSALDSTEAELQTRVTALERELAAARARRKTLLQEEAGRRQRVTAKTNGIGTLRKLDSAARIQAPKAAQ